MTQEPSIFQFVIVPLNLCTSSPFRWDGTPSLTSHIHLLACNGAWPNCSKWVLTGGHTSSNQQLTWNTRKSLGGICAQLFFLKKAVRIDGRPEFPNLFHQFFFPPSDFVEGKPEAKNRRMIFIRRGVCQRVWKFSWEPQLRQSPWGLLWIPIGLWCVTWHPLGWVGVKNQRFRLDRKIAGCSLPPVGNRMNTEMMGSFQPAHVYLFPVPHLFLKYRKDAGWKKTLGVHAEHLANELSILGQCPKMVLPSPLLPLLHDSWRCFSRLFVFQNVWDSTRMTTMTWFDPAC